MRRIGCTSDATRSWREGATDAKDEGIEKTYVDSEMEQLPPKYVKKSCRKKENVKNVKKTWQEQKKFKTLNKNVIPIICLISCLVFNMYMQFN